MEVGSHHLYWSLGGVLEMLHAPICRLVTECLGIADPGRAGVHGAGSATARLCLAKAHASTALAMLSQAITNLVLWRLSVR